MTKSKSNTYPGGILRFWKPPSPGQNLEAPDTETRVCDLKILLGGRGWSSTKKQISTWHCVFDVQYPAAIVGKNGKFWSTALPLGVRQSSSNLERIEARRSRGPRSRGNSVRRVEACSRGPAESRSGGSRHGGVEVWGSRPGGVEVWGSRPGGVVVWGVQAQRSRGLQRSCRSPCPRRLVRLAQQPQPEQPRPSDRARQSPDRARTEHGIEPRPIL